MLAIYPSVICMKFLFYSVWLRRYCTFIMKKKWIEKN